MTHTTHAAFDAIVVEEEIVFSLSGLCQAPLLLFKMQRWP